MKNLMNCAKKTIICVVIALVFFFSSVSPAHAIDPVTGTTIIANTLASIASLITIGSSESWGEAKWQEVIDEIDSVWRVTPSYSNVVEITTDQLYDLYLDACEKGFPCRIVERPIAGSWYYCIEGTGVVANLPNAYFSWFTEDDVDISSRILTAADGWAYVSNVPMTSNEYLRYIYSEFGSVLQSINDHLDNIYYRVTKLYDYITGSPNGESPGVSLYNKLDQVINAINGISVSGGSFDVTPIVDKLQATIDAADERLTLLLSDLGGHVDTIVDAIPDPVDLQPVNDRIDAVVEEVRKISTFSDLNEIVTVTPGVLGDVDVVTDGDWWYEDLTFYYEPDEGFVPDGSLEWSLNTDNIWVDDDGSASVDHITWDYNTWGGTDVSISLTDDFYAHMEDIPEFYLEFVESGGYTVFTVSMQDLLSGTLYYSVYNPAEIFCIRVVFPANAYVFQSGMAGFDLLTFKYGSFDTPMTSHLSFTVDGVPHTLYWWNEYEFVSDGTVWSGIFLRYTDGHWYLEDSSGTVWPVLYYDAYLTDALTSAPTTTTTIEGETYTWFEWFYTSFKGGGSLDVTPIVSKLKDIENALSNMGSDIDIENNTNININEENENYNIFYVDDPDGGEDKSIVDLSGDTLKVFGQLLDFLYKVGFKGALDDAGGGIGDLSDFYLDTSEGSADLWVS